MKHFNTENMLLNNFFMIRNIEFADKHLVDIELNPHHNIYKGHFPGQAVMPGVCLTQIVKETAEHITGKKLMMENGDNIKFTAVLDPNVHRKVKLSLAIKNREDGLLQADSSVFSGDISFFSFKGSFRQSERE